MEHKGEDTNLENESVEKNKIKKENQEGFEDKQNSPYSNVNVMVGHAHIANTSQKTRPKSPKSLDDPQWTEDLKNILQRLSTAKHSSEDTLSSQKEAMEQITPKYCSAKFEEKMKVGNTACPLKQETKNIKKKIIYKDNIFKSGNKHQKDSSSSQNSLEFGDKNEKPQMNITRQKLLTQSHYEGIWQEALQCMDGYGTYTFPDGSVYRGYFSRGHFHGYGTLHLAAPYNFTYKATFIRGHIHEIEDMWFDDGLHVTATFKEGKADFSKWKYCCAADRRYASEQVEGLPAVGPFSNLTHQTPNRELNKIFYDVVEGFYNPSSGLIVDRPPPLTNISVPCREQVEWIKKNCRRGQGLPKETPAAICQQIVQNNLESEVEMKEHDPACNYIQGEHHKRYFAKLCQDGPLGKASVETFGYRSADSSCSSNPSISDHSITLDVQEQLETARQFGNLQLGRNLEAEQSTLMTKPFKKVTGRVAFTFGKTK